MTYEKWLLLPVVLHFFMTVVVGVLMGRARLRGVSSGRVRRADIVNNTKAWPEDILKIGNNFDNQFQMPLSWYGCVAFILVTGSVNLTLVWLSWLFFVSRALHTIEHLGANVVQRRFYFYLVGYVALTAMWLWFAVSYFVIG